MKTIETQVRDHPISLRGGVSTMVSNDGVHDLCLEWLDSVAATDSEYNVVLVSE